MTQEALTQRGHAIECRVYAEDPAQGFLPQAGPLLLYREPQGPGIRVDSGVAEGGEVSVHYDPLLAKLIVLGRDARSRAPRAPSPRFASFAILGIRTNIPFLLQIARASERSSTRSIDTGFLDREGARAGAADADAALPRRRPLVALARAPTRTGIRHA